MQKKFCENEHDISLHIKSLTKYLRNQYYINSQKQDNCDTIPFGGSIRESIGPFPEFILKGRFCKRSLEGLCSPCFYSRLPEHNISKKEFDEGYIAQVDFIKNNFENLVLKNQIGNVAFPSKKSSKPVYGMVCTPTGSYFDESEYPAKVRKNILKKLIEITIQNNCEIALHIETHVEDILSYFSQPDNEELVLLSKLNARVILGFESSSDFSRNILYNKELKLSDFEKAVKILKSNKFPVGAFVFAGLFAYNDFETINDVKNTLIYLKNLCVSPVIMFANTQKYTIPDVLLGKYYKLLDAHTILEIVKIVVDMFGCNMEGHIDPWFIADPKGGPPEPNMHIFNASTNTACNKCSDEIYNAIEQLRITKNKKEFEESYNKLSTCNCLNDYKALMDNDIESTNKNDLIKKINILLDYVEKQKEYYVLKENPWLVKSDLLCYGIHFDKEQKDLLLNENPYAYEKGLINAVHIVYRGLYINICIAEKFCQNSPYTAKYISNEWTLFKDGIPIDSFSFLKMPEWVLKKCDNKYIGEIIRPHNNNCLSIWPSTLCTYIRNNNGCKFCGLNSANQYHEIIKKENILFSIKEAFKYNPQYEINLSGGTCESPEKAIEYLSDLCKEIIKIKSDTSISVECAPPKDNEWLKMLYDNGVSAVIMNIEIYNNELRKQICPGKSQISIERYFSALEYAVDLFGRGNVSSVLIMGIQPAEDIKKAALKLIELGVIPTIMPFKPLDNTEMENYSVPNSSEYSEISRFVARTMSKHNLKICDKSGCAACGACSLESNLT